MILTDERLEQLWNKMDNTGTLELDEIGELYDSVVDLMQENAQLRREVMRLKRQLRLGASA